MRKMLGIFLFSICTSAFSYSVEAIYHRMAHANHLKEMPISVKPYDEKCSLACNNGHEIIVSELLLALVENEDELAGVIGHEMAHNIYQDELKADVLGLQYAYRTGYKYCKAAQFLKRFKEDKHHPSGEVRYKNSGCY